MAWWEFEPEKKYPWVALEPPRDDDARILLSLFLGIGGIVLLLASLVGLLFNAGFAGWGIAISIACVCAAQVVLPGAKSRK